MTFMKQIFSCIILVPVFFMTISCSDPKTEPVGYVNPYIGNISHLLVPTYPTVHLPNSMLRFYPDRDNFTTNKMQGFPLNVVSHRGGRAFSMIPYQGNAAEMPGNLPFTYDNEIITPSFTA
jgi:hypothetical protein